MILIIQVPLKVAVRQRYQYEDEDEVKGKKSMVENCALSSIPQSNKRHNQKKKKAEVEKAIIKIGKVEGEYREIGNCKIERDPSFPVRVTLQYYKATSNGVVDEIHIKAISDQIKESRKYCEDIGSLVVGGNTGRVTEHHLICVPPTKIPIWWDEFWLMYGPVYPQYKTSLEAANHVFMNGRFSTSSLTDCQAQVLYLLGNKINNNSTPSWNVL